MQTRNIFTIAAALASACLTVSFVGCGSSSNSAGPGTDSGTESDSTSGGDTSMTEDSGVGGDSSPGDSAPNVDSGTDSGMMATCTPPTGTPLVASTTVTVQGVTGDDQVIYYDSAAKTLSAVPAAGGSPAMIGAWDLGTGEAVSTIGNAAYFYNGATQTAAPAFGKLTVWTAAHGAVTLGASATTKAWSIAGGVDFSADGNSVLYTDNATATTADVWVAGVDGTGAKLLVGSVQYSASCAPYLKFIGNTAVVGSCGAGVDAGAGTVANITAFSGTSWGTTTAIAAGNGYSVFSGDKAGNQIAYLTATGQYVRTLTPTLGTATLIDALGIGGATFTSDGLNLLYFENSGSLFRSTVATPAPELVAAGMWGGSLALSPDDLNMYLFKTVAANGFTTDVYATSTAAVDGGNATIALTAMTSGALFGPGFTADNSIGLYFTKVAASAANANDYVGEFDQVPLPVTAPGKAIASNVWEEWTTTAKKALYDDNYAVGGQNGLADIEAVDLSMATVTPSKLVTSADANFFVSSDKSKYLFSWNQVAACPAGKAGVYAAAAP